MMEENKKYLTNSGLRISRTAFPNLKGKSDFKKAEVKNDQFLQLLQEDSYEMIFIIDSQGEIKYSNHAVSKMLGYSEFNLKELSIQKIIAVKQWVLFRAALRASEEDLKEATQIDCQFINAKNREIDFNLSVKDYRHHPLVEGYIIHAKNINRLRKQEKKIELRDLALGTIEEAVAIVSIKGPTIEFANSNFFSLTGFTKKEVFGRTINLFEPPYSDMLIVGKYAPKMKEKFWKTLSFGKPFKERIWSKKKNGSVFYNRIKIKPVKNSSGELVRFIASMKEIKKRS